MVRSFEAIRLPAFPDFMLCPHCLQHVEIPAGWLSLGCCPVCYLNGHAVATGDPRECRACRPPLGSVARA